MTHLLDYLLEKLNSINASIDWTEYTDGIEVSISEFYDGGLTEENIDEWISDTKSNCPEFFTDPENC